MTARLAPLLALLSACTGAPEPSSLEQRSATKTATTPANSPAELPALAPTKAAPTKDAAPPPAKAADVAPGQLTAEPPAGTELLPVRLALTDASVYKVTTIGMVAYSNLLKPAGYAREERLELGPCSGADAARRCRLTHRYVHFEAEPPQGRFYETDEKLVNELVTQHELLATGAREGATTVTGPAAQVDSPAGKALTDVHRFYCIRFPEQPIGVGAKWRDLCHTRTGGAVDTRDVVWELTRIDADAEGKRRAEFTYLGTYEAPDAKGTKKGTISGVLYFLLDAGEPHLLKEKFVTRPDPESKFEATTTIAYQFARVIKDAKGKEKDVRTDGAPFPPQPSAPAQPPAPASPAAK